MRDRLDSSWRLRSTVRRGNEQLLYALVGDAEDISSHQTLRATVEWSYSLLDERDRTTFDRLGVFAGSFDADAATAVAGADALAVWDVRDALDALAAKSMIQPDDGPDGSTRFRLLEGCLAAADLGTWEFAATLGCALTDGPVAALIYGTPAIAYRDAALDRARAHLDHVRYDAARARGAVMSYEQIVEYTLAELDRL